MKKPSCASLSLVTVALGHKPLFTQASLLNPSLPTCDNVHMRILYVNNLFSTPSSPERGSFVNTQIESLVNMGIEARVIVLRSNRSKISEYLVLPSRIRKEIQDFRPDIIHAMYGSFLSLTTSCSSAHTPVIISFCGSDLHGLYRSRGLDWLLAELGVLASKQAGRIANGIIVKSEELKSLLPNSIMDRKPISIIPNGVDFSLFDPDTIKSAKEELGWNLDSKHILFGASPEQRNKRFDLAEEAVKQVRDRGIACTLHVLGGIAPRQIPRLLCAADVLLFTSQHEGSPNIVKEAMALGRPIVTVDVGDVRNVLRGTEGTVIVERDPALIAQALIDTLGRFTTTEGRAAITDLRMENAAERVISLYQQVLN